MNTERRPALVPGSDLLSSGKAQQFIQHFVPPSVVSPLDSQKNQSDLRTTADRGSLERQPSGERRKEALRSSTKNKTLQCQDGYGILSGGSSHSIYRSRKGTFQVPSRERQRKLSTWNCLAHHANPSHVQIDNKRKHAMYSQDDQRQYSVEMSENIPHMSEIDSEPPFREIFGDRGVCSVFGDVSFSSYLRTRFDTKEQWCRIGVADSTFLGRLTLATLHHLSAPFRREILRQLDVLFSGVTRSARLPGVTT